MKNLQATFLKLPFIKLTTKLFIYREISQSYSNFLNSSIFKYFFFKYDILNKTIKV